MNTPIRHAKRLLIAVVGFTILAIGLAMVILPGPAVVVIPIGLGILATEFLWARKLLKNINNKFQTRKRGMYAAKTE